MRSRLLAALSILLLIILPQFAGPVAAQYEWTCTYNFLVSGSGFVASAFTFGSSGVWSAGVGWIGEFGVSDGDSYHMVQIVKEIPISHVTFMEVSFEIENGTQGAGAIPLALAAGPMNLGTSSTAPSDGTGTFSAMGDQPAANTLSLRVQSGFLPGTSFDPGGNVVVTQLTVSGLGEPPSGEPCDDDGGEPLEASFEAAPSSGPAPLNVNFTNTTTGASESAVYDWDYGDGNGVEDAFNTVKIFSVPGIYTVTLTVTDGEHADTYSDVIEVTHGLDGDFYKPLAPQDADTSLLYPPEQDGLFDMVYAEEAAIENGGYEPFAVKALNFFANLKNSLTGAGAVSTPDMSVVTAVSASPDRPIHAVADGEVVSVEPVPECGTGAITRCIFHIPKGLTGAPKETILRTEMSEAFVVVVAVGDREIRYIVANPQVTAGASITAGCIIGYTMEAIKLAQWELQSVSEELGGTIDDSGSISVGGSVTGTYTLTSQIVPYGVAFLRFVEAGETLPLLEELDQEPTSLVPCNADPTHATCQGDASLSDPQLWDKTNGVIWEAGGTPTLAGGAAITEQLSLSPSTAYQMSVQARRGSGSGATSITLQIGGTVQTFPMVAQYATYTIDAAIHEADVGLFYSVSVLNSGAVPFELLGVCVSEEGAGEQEPNVCVFTNPALEDDGATWSLSEGVSSGFNSGELIMPNGATIAQQIRLYPNGAGAYEYVVQLHASVFGEGWESETASEVAFNWQFGSESGAFMAPSGVIDGISFQSFVTSPPYTATRRAGNELVFEAIVEVDAPIEAPFIIESVVSLSGGFSGGVMIREACVTNPFAESDVGGAGGGLPFPTNCNAVSAPSDERLSSWTYFLWSSMDRFFQCDLMTMLNKIFKVGYDGLTLARWQMQFWQSYLTYVGQWLGNTFVPWLNGHFANMARANGVTLVQSGESGGVGFWDVLLAIINNVVGPILTLLRDIINAVFGLMLDVIRRFIELVFKFIGLLFDLIGTLFTWIAALAYAWNNSAPAELSWLPNCTLNPQQTFCIPSWIAENTILSGVGAFIIPLLVSIQVIDLLMWAIFAATDAIQRSGEVS